MAPGDGSGRRTGSARARGYLYLPMGWLDSILLSFVALLAVDLVSGLVHWAEDTFGTEATPVVGRWIIAPNVVHHRDAAAFTRNGWLASSWDLLLGALLSGLLAWRLGWLSWPVVLFCLVGANANEIHKWNHLGSERVPSFVRGLWRSGVLQAPEHHSGHHRGAKNTRYCVVTPWLNPLLDRSGFWRGLERLLVPWFGAPRREDLAPTARNPDGP